MLKSSSAPRMNLTLNLAEGQPAPSSYHHRLFRVASLYLEMPVVDLSLLNSSLRLGDDGAGNSKSVQSKMGFAKFESADQNNIEVPLQVLTNGSRSSQEAWKTSPDTIDDCPWL
jgi:hypothetical protein